MKRLLLFFVLTYAFAWACFAAIALWPMPPFLRSALEILLAFAPGLAAIFLTALRDGSAGVRALLRPILQGQVPIRWYLFALFFPPAVKLLVAIIIRIFTGTWPAFGHNPWPLLLVAALFSTPFQAGEEVGWRGYALPQLAARIGLAPASLLLGAIWACWHLPKFYIPSADAYHQSFPLYFLHVVALSVAIAWLWARTQRSLLLPMLFHAAINNFQDLVPSASVHATHVFTLHASLAGWVTVILFWIAAAVFLATMPRTNPLQPLFGMALPD